MNLLISEVNFLKEFRKRFASYTEYKAALGDMLDAGLITASAYNRIVKKVKPTKVVTDAGVTKKIKKKIPIKKASNTDYRSYCDRGYSDSCARETFRSTCDSRRSNC